MQTFMLLHICGQEMGAYIHSVDTIPPAGCIQEVIRVCMACHVTLSQPVRSHITKITICT